MAVVTAKVFVNLSLVHCHLSGSVLEDAFVDSYKALVSAKHNTKIQVHKKYIINDTNQGNHSAKFTQNMCVNPYILQITWKACLR